MSCSFWIAAIGWGKELIAACAVEAKVPGYRSLATASVQELEHASTSAIYLTAAMLYRNLIQRALNGSLNARRHQSMPSCRPMHAPIFLIPQRPFTPPTWPNDIPVSVTLSIWLRETSSTAVYQVSSPPGHESDENPSTSP
jgi:hypothetical protein